MKMNKKSFTLFELLISVGLLVIITVVLLRTFVLTSDYWSVSHEQSRLYADAKTIFSLLTEDIGNIVYQQESSADAADVAANPTKYVTAPLWIGAMNYTAGKAINSYSGYSGNSNVGASLHMITRTARGLSDEAGSYVSQVSYYFVPPTQSGSDWSKVYSGDGILARYCAGDDSSFYKFMDSKDVNAIYKAPTEEELNPTEAIKEVITGILDFRVYAYVSKGDWDAAVYPANLVSRAGAAIQIVNGHDGAGQTDLTGAKNIETIQIVFTLIPPERLPDLRNITDSTERKEYLHKYSRTFRKTFRIRKFTEGI